MLCQELSVLPPQLTLQVAMLLVPTAEIDRLACFPLRIPEFLTPIEQLDLQECLDRHEARFGELGGEADYWRGRTLTPCRIPDAAVLQAFRQIRDRIVATVTEVLTDGLGTLPPLYADVINFARWPVGYELHPHADAENPDGSPHPFPWRALAAVLYLNDDYGGGEIYFPNLGLQLKPRPGTLVVFPGTLKYLHGVRPVTSGMRHTLAAFLTFDADKAYHF